MKNDSTNTEIVFSARHINLSYGSKQVLKDVNIDIHNKKVTAFIGPSGCGKSTFLRCFNRLNDLIPDCHIDGQLTYCQKSIYDYDSIALRSQIGMVFQNPNPFPLSIFDNVAYGPRCQGIKNRNLLEQIVINALKKAALYEEVKSRLKSSALSLSGGQQQRLCIARAIAMEPEIILMDEPTSALDPIATLKIEKLIEELKKDYSIVIVTHNMQQATRISDYTAFFVLGEIIEFNKTTELFSHPTKKKTEDYITGRFG
ncbi:MAG: phosphate ABC transporter ATP-binding protein PstB [Bacilli bacterium]|nr:phosphate ABC transporter ATP-binding protein PstB [Bacilli bacterium]